MSAATPDLPAMWDSLADEQIAIAESTRSLDLHVQSYARAAQLRQCAIQYRLATGTRSAPDHRALLDKATGLPGTRQAAGELRASGGLEALT